MKLTNDQLNKALALFGKIDYSPLENGEFEVEIPRQIKIEKLKFHPLNSEIYGENEDVSLLASQIEQSGWIKAFEINLNGEVLGGNRRLLAVQQLREKGEPIELVDFNLKIFGSLEEEQYFLILDNAGRLKTNLQKARELQATRTFFSFLQQKQGGELTDAQKACLEEWEKKKEQIKEKKKGTRNPKTRDVLGEQAGWSGANVDKALKVVELIDYFYRRGDETSLREAEELEKAMDQSVDAAFKQFKAWEKEHPLQWVYKGKPHGYLSKGQVVHRVYCAEDSDTTIAVVRIPKTPEAPDFPDLDYRVKEKDIYPYEPPKEEVKEDKPKLTPQVQPLKFQKGDKACYIKNGNGLVVGTLTNFIEGAGWGIEFDDGSYFPAIPETELVTPPQFKVEDWVRHQLNGSQGEITKIFTELSGHFPVIRYEYGDGDIASESHLKLIGNQQELIEPKQHPKFKIGGYYEHKMAGIMICLNTQSSLIQMKWIGMGNHFTPEWGIKSFSLKDEEDYEILSDIQPYKFSPFNYPKFTLSRLQKGDLVAPSWKPEATGIITKCDDDGYWHFDNGEKQQLKEEQIQVIKRVGCDFSVGDKVKVDLDSYFPEIDRLGGQVGEIVKVHQHCCDINFPNPENKISGFDTVRLLYEWIKPIDDVSSFKFKEGDIVEAQGINGVVYKCHLPKGNFGNCYTVEFDKPLEGKSGKKAVVEEAALTLLQEDKIYQLKSFADCLCVDDFYKFFNSLNPDQLETQVYELWETYLNQKGGH